eukprot:gene47854-64910_t
MGVNEVTRAACLQPVVQEGAQLLRLGRVEHFAGAGLPDGALVH